MAMEEQGKPGEARDLFLQAWKEATNDFEKFLAAFYVSRHQINVDEKLIWLRTTLQLALKLNDETVTASFPSLYSSMAECYQELGDIDSAKKNYELAKTYTGNPSDKGPFYHGTRADLKIG